ncbi:hypothetical protein WJX73_001106 [Symbiochloris irregularis]|uniref:Uncharacterized protein n=1 Tax=Symbiochloris irregularis TaxID=706552 RepID=A0AAW1NWE9_9CHLO
MSVTPAEQRFGASDFGRTTDTSPCASACEQSTVTQDSVYCTPRELSVSPAAGFFNTAPKNECKVSPFLQRLKVLDLLKKLKQDSLEL